MIDFDADCLFDAEFDRINKAIRLSDMLTAPFERINNAKFSICQKTEEGDTTFIDELFRYLSEEHNYFQALSSYFLQEIFDTDALKMDAKYYGNIKKMFVEQRDEILRFVKMNGDTFSVGLRYYYWDYYKNIKELERQTIGVWDNTHSHSGYRVCDLYVEAKYPNFKDEALNYKHFDMKMLKRKFIKALKYLQTEEIKKMKARDELLFTEIHYGIETNAVIRLNHLLALVFYTDLTKLSTEFSSTFRRVTKYETLKSMKQRNALFYWMSRYLRELVEIFGQCSRGDTFEKDINDYEGYNYDKPMDALRGPFYCGMDCELNVDAFAMRLNGPTSTSKHIEVALKFSGTQGVIFTFDNPSRNIQYMCLRGWNCSWISSFKQESEILFFGGYHRIKLVTVRLIATKSNFSEYVEAIWYLDSMINGTDMQKIESSKNTFFALQNLINYVLKKPVKATFDGYIIDTFLCFVNNKQHIALCLPILDQFGNANVNGLILSPLHQLRFVAEVKRNDNDCSNLILPDLLRLFPNVKSMTITTSSMPLGDYSFSFSLIGLLSLISESNLDKIVIKASGPCAWYHHIFGESDKKNILIKAFAAKNFKINGDGLGSKSDKWLIISRDRDVF